MSESVPIENVSFIQIGTFDFSGLVTCCVSKVLILGKIWKFTAQIKQGTCLGYLCWEFATF